MLLRQWRHIAKIGGPGEEEGGGGGVGELTSFTLFVRTQPILYVLKPQYLYVDMILYTLDNQYIYAV